MDVKDTVRLCCLREQSHEESQIDFMTLEQVKGKTFSKHLSNLADTYKLDAIYFDYHGLGKSYYKGLYTPSVISNVKNVKEKTMMSQDVSIVFPYSRHILRLFYEKVDFLETWSLSYMTRDMI